MIRPVRLNTRRNPSAPALEWKPSPYNELRRDGILQYDAVEDQTHPSWREGWERSDRYQLEVRPDRVHLRVTMNMGHSDYPNDTTWHFEWPNTANTDAAVREAKAVAEKLNTLAAESPESVIEDEREMETVFPAPRSFLIREG